MKKGPLAIVITSCLVAIGRLVALVAHLQSQSRREARFLSSPVVLLDELAADPGAYEGKQIAVICYLWPGVEGIGLSAMPTSKRWKYDAALERNVITGADLLARCNPGWDLALLNSSGQNDYQTGEKPVIVQGFVHAAGYGKAGSLLQDSPYLDLHTCRPLLKAGGRMADAVMEE